MGSWHFQHEVGIVWYSQESSKRHSPKYDVVLRWPIDHYEVESFTPEVIGLAEDYIQSHFA